jgi:hypothetical protein
MATGTKQEKPAETDQKSKAAFDLKLITIKKLKHIGAYEGRFQNEILEQVLSEYFTNWEKANHKIPIKVK